MKRKRPKQNYTAEFKAPIIQRLRDGEPYSKVSADINVSDNTLRKWVKSAYGTSSIAAANGHGKTSKADGRMELWTKNREAQLMQIIGQQAVEIAQLRAKLR